MHSIDHRLAYHYPPGKAKKRWHTHTDLRPDHHRQVAQKHANGSPWEVLREHLPHTR